MHSNYIIVPIIRGEVRNLGKPVALCKQYYDGGADEIVFLNITSFRQGESLMKPDPFKDDCSDKTHLVSVLQCCRRHRGLAHVEGTRADV